MAKHSEPLAEKYKLRPKNHGKRWSELDVQLLLLMLHKKKRIPFVADVLGRREGACTLEFYKAVRCGSYIPRSKYLRGMYADYERMLTNTQRKQCVSFTVPCRHFSAHKGEVKHG